MSKLNKYNIISGTANNTKKYNFPPQKIIQKPKGRKKSWNKIDNKNSHKKRNGKPEIGLLS